MNNNWNNTKWVLKSRAKTNTPNIRIRIRFEFVRNNFAIRNIEAKGWQTLVMRNLYQSLQMLCESSSLHGKMSTSNEIPFRSLQTNRKSLCNSIKR